MEPIEPVDNFKTGQMKQVEFFQHWTQQATSYPSPQCLIDQIQIQEPILVVAKDQMPDHTKIKE